MVLPGWEDLLYNPQPKGEPDGILLRSTHLRLWTRDELELETFR